MEVNYNGYPVFKGLQKPLEFMGIRGKFLYYAAGAVGLSFLGFILFSIILGKLAGFVALVVIFALCLAAIYLKQKSGLHSKRKDKGIFMFHTLFAH